MPENGFDGWELRALDRFATKAQVEVINNKVEAVTTTVMEQGKLLARLDLTMEAIRTILVRIAWLIATPIVGGIGIGIVWILVQAVNSGLF